MSTRRDVSTGATTRCKPACFKITPNGLQVEGRDEVVKNHHRRHRQPRRH